MMDSEDKRPGPRSVTPGAEAEYEPCTAGSLPNGQMAFLQGIQEKFLDAFALALATRVEKPVAAKLVPAQQAGRSAFQQSCEDGGCLFTLDAEPVRSQALVDFSAGLVAYLLRVLLCAPPGSADGARPVTDIERHILREIFELLAHELTASWKLADIAFRSRSSAVREAAGQDTLLVFECQLALEDAQETFRVAIPAFLARVAASQSVSAVVEETPAPVREMICNALCHGKVNVEAVLSNSTLRMGDLLAMQPGHVMMLSQAAGSPVECRIGGKPKFHGDWIRHANRNALVLL